MSERDETSPERLRTLAEYGDHYHDERAVLAAELLAARDRLAAAERERAAADALAEAWEAFTDCPDHAQNVGWCRACVANVQAHGALDAALAAYRAARGAR